MDYDKYIADAAQEYVKNNFKHALYRTEKTEQALSETYEKLCWMLDARLHKWNPELYKPERFKPGGL